MPAARPIHRSLPVHCVRALGTAALTGALLAAGAPEATAAPVWSRPVTPLTVTRPFQPPPTPYAAGHRGADLAGGAGQVVRAAGGGVISFAAPLAGRGVVVVVHGELRTTYEPVTASVHRGDRVAAGAPIGVLEPGHAGCPAAACLHWGLLRGDTYLDPLALLGPQPVRLLPLAGGAGVGGAGARSAVRAAAAARTAPAGDRGPGAATWSLVAVAGAGALVAAGRRR